MVRVKDIFEHMTNLNYLIQEAVWDVENSDLGNELEVNMLAQNLKSLIEFYDSHDYWNFANEDGQKEYELSLELIKANCA